MKTPIILLACLLLLAGCYFLPIPAKEDSPTDDKLSFEDSVPEIQWLTFESNELGLTFRYPEILTVEISTELAGFDEGKKFELSTASFAMAAVSSDFEPGITEGCCFYFAGDPLDLSAGDDEISARIESELGEISGFQRVIIDEQEAAMFVRTNVYADTWQTETIILPYQKYGFANLMISGPDQDSDAEEKAFFEEILTSLHFM